MIAQAAKHGVIVHPLSHHYLGSPTRNALLLGYGGLTNEQIREGAEKLVATIQEQL
jgi:DNA-binding transcriptional MocR family regulator